MIPKAESIPKDIKLLAWATSIRWIGWGFVEALIPVFLFSFSQSYAETGILRSIYDIAFFLALPVAGMLADKISSKTLIIIGLIIYPFIGFSYFLAGATGIVAFVVLTRLLNGVAYALDSTGRNTYFRRHVPSHPISSVFGYFETLTNSWWIVAVLSSLFLVKLVQIHWLFLAIVPTSLIALVMISRLKTEKGDGLPDGFKKILQDGIYFGIWKEIKNWGAGLRTFALLNFFLGFISVVSSFFIPIYAYNEGATLPQVILITAALATPAVFGSLLGKIADRKRGVAIFFGLGMLFVLLISLSLVGGYISQLGIAFGIGFALELIQLASDGGATRISSAEHYGRLGSAMEGIGSIGSLIGPVTLGFLVDLIGAPRYFLAMSVLTLLVLFVLLIKRHKLEEVSSKKLVL